MTYHLITRDELEAWLDESPFPWDHKYGGIYHIHLSEHVAVKLSSTIGSRDDAMGKGKASADMVLASRVNGRCINRKAKDRDHFKRTSGWRKRWLEGLLHWRGVFNKCPGFYNRIAQEEPRRKAASKPKPKPMSEMTKEERMAEYSRRIDENSKRDDIRYAKESERLIQKRMRDLGWTREQLQNRADRQGRSLAEMVRIEVAAEKREKAHAKWKAWNRRKEGPGREWGPSYCGPSKKWNSKGGWDE